MVKGIERDIGEIEGLAIEQRLGRLDGMLAKKCME